MVYETIKYASIEDGIGHLTLNRPKSYNAVNTTMLDDLERFWKDRYDDLDTHVLILTGATSSKGFCAGLDTKEAFEIIPGMTGSEFFRFQSRLARLRQHLHNYLTPTPLYSPRYRPARVHPCVASGC